MLPRAARILERLSASGLPDAVAMRALAVLKDDMDAADIGASLCWATAELTHGYDAGP